MIHLQSLIFDLEKPISNAWSYTKYMIYKGYYWLVYRAFHQQIILFNFLKKFLPVFVNVCSWASNCPVDV